VGRALDPDLNVSEVSRKHVTDIFQDRFNPQAVIEKIARDTPEMLDVLMRLPQLAASGVTFLEEQLSDRRPQRPLAGLRSGILAGSCLIAGALVVVQGGPILLWIAFFLAAILLAIFGG